MEKNSGIAKFTIRRAEIDDVPVILSFIRELAVYEKLLHEVVATEDSLRENLFGDNKYAEVLLGIYDGEPVGFALYFHNYSTFLGRPGIHLEDLYVKPAIRGNGIGRALLAYLARIAVERGCGRLEWNVLDWNEPAIRFYKSIGALAMDGWTTHRLTGEALEQLAGQL